MRFRVLGPLAVLTDDGRQVLVPGLKVRALLVDLLVHAGQPASVDRLIEDLWGSNPPSNPTSALQAKVSRLRSALDSAESGARELVVFRPAGYMIDIEPTAIDAGLFVALAGRARASEDMWERVRLFAEALSLWRGPALADFADAPFARAAVIRAEEARVAVLEEYVEARLACGEHSQLVGELNELVLRHPLRERLRAAHIRALYRGGRQSEALASYDDLRRQLKEELGLDPGPELVELHEAILRQDRSLETERVEAVAATVRSRTNLPAPITGLIGRTEVVDEVSGLLTANRLVTLIGSGGVGKTRLAVEIAHRLADRFPDGVWLVELAALGRTENVGGEGVLAATMAVLGIREGVASAAPGQQVALHARLSAALRAKEVLLLLDNCEHVVEEVVAVVDPLLRTAPNLRVLATSQEPLGLAGEIVRQVKPLELPGYAMGRDPAELSRYSAVQLFVSRAAAASPGFTLTEANAQAVAVLCNRLDGIPLALELAATRVRALGVHELVARLDDRFRLLATGHRGAPPRQQTLRAMIDWSWGLLTSAERVLLRRISVFTDGCPLAAAEEVCAGDGVRPRDVVEVLARLVDRSLVVVVETPDGVRYRLLESVAAYCVERLRQANETGRIHERYMQYYVNLVTRAGEHLRGAAQQQWLQVLDMESANIRRALDHAMRDCRTEWAFQLVNGLAWYWFMRGRLREAHQSLSSVLAIGTQTPVAGAAHASAWRAGIALIAGEVADRAAYSRMALRAFDNVDDPRGLAYARWFLGLALYITGDLVTSENLIMQALRGFQKAGDKWGTAAALSERAKQALVRGDLDALRRDGTRSAELFREIGDGWGQLQTVYPLAALAEINGDYDRAAGLHRDGLRIAQDLGLWTEAADRLSGLGRIALLTGDVEGARMLHEQARCLSVEQGFKPGEMYALIGLALGARRSGELGEAENHLRAVLEWNRQVDAEPGNTLILAELGFVAELRGEVQTAREMHLAGYAAARLIGDPRAMALALEGLAGVEALAGGHANAVVLLGAAAAARESTGFPLPAAERGDVDRISAVARAGLSADEYAAALARGRTLSPEEAGSLVAA